MSLTVDQRNAATKLIAGKLKAVRDEKIALMPGYMEARENARIGGDYRKVTDILERINALQDQIEKAEEIQKDLAKVAGWSDHRYFHAHDFGPWAADRLKEIAEKNLDEWVKAQPGYDDVKKIDEAVDDVELSIELATSPSALKQLVTRLQSEHGFEVSATVKTALGIPSKD